MMKTRLDDEQTKALRAICTSRIRMVSQKIETNPDDTELLNQMEELSELFKVLGSSVIHIVSSEDEAQHTEVDSQCGGFKESESSLAEVEGILAKVSKNGLSKDNKEKLERYCDCHCAEPGFYRVFVPAFSAARSTYFHSDDDRGLLTFGISLIALTVSLLNLFPRDTISFSTDSALVLSLASIAALAVCWFEIMKKAHFKRKKHIDNMEEFYFKIKSSATFNSLSFAE